MLGKKWQTITRWSHEISIDLDISFNGCNGECGERCAVNQVKVESKQQSDALVD